MQRDLKFNICGIETSHCRHLEIEGIQKRIDITITPMLIYATRYWADHLELGSSAQLGDEVTDFIKHRFLYWIEVFALKSQMSTISVILRKVMKRAKVGFFC